VRHVLRLLIRARRLGATEVTRSLGEVLSSHWKGVEESFREVANLYNAQYLEEVGRMQSRPGKGGK